MQDVEFICVNDGSKDGSLAILNEYAAKDSRFKIISQKNQGYGKAMNVGIKAASGEYIAILESDDFIGGDMLRFLYDVAVRNNADIVKSNFYFSSVEKNVKSDFVDDNFYNRVINPRREYPEWFITPVYIWDGIYRRDFLRKNNINFHETPGASFQDVSFCIETMGSAEKVVFVKEAFIHYRVDSVGASCQSMEKVKCIFDEFTEANRYFGEHKHLCGDMYPIISAMKCMHYYGHFHRVSWSNKEKFLSYLLKDMDEDRKSGRIDQRYWPDREEWNLMRALLDNRQKTVYDMRMKWQRMRLYQIAFINLLDAGSRIYVYGAGKVAVQIMQWLFDRGCAPSGILVSDVNANPKDVLGVKVIGIDEFAGKDDNLILVSVAEKSQAEIIDMLKNKGCRNVIAMTDELRDAIRLM